VPRAEEDIGSAFPESLHGGASTTDTGKDAEISILDVVSERGPNSL
jgi:hypothetical protein